MRIGYQPKSTLGFLIAISAIALFTAIVMAPSQPDVSRELESLFRPLFGLGIGVWICFIILALSRNARSFLR